MAADVQAAWAEAEVTKYLSCPQYILRPLVSAWVLEGSWRGPGGVLEQHVLSDLRRLPAGRQGPSRSEDIPRDVTRRPAPPRPATPRTAAVFADKW